MNQKKKRVSRINKKERTPANTVTSRRIRICMMTLFVILAGLIVRIGFLQFVNGDSLQMRATSQQTLTETISPINSSLPLKLINLLSSVYPKS